MKKLKLLLLLLVSGFILGANAQDTIKGLIFSEHRFMDPHQGYLELCNTGTETVDLANVTLANVTGKTLSNATGQWRINSAPNSGNQLRLSGELAPGGTWVIMGVSDRFAPGTQLPDHRLDLLALADEYCMTGNAFGVTDTIIPEWQMWGDSASIHSGLMWNWGSKAYVIFGHLANGDSIMLDQARLLLDENNVAVNGWTDVAGIPEASRYYTLVRKATVTQGNMVWNNSKGATLEDSEWIPIPNQPSSSRISFNTIKNHGDFHIDVQSTTVDVDMDNSKLTVPWGIYKGDSILSYLELGPGMAWGYVEDGDVADSTHAIMQNGDTLIMYAAGNNLEQVNFEIQVLDPAADQATVYPLKYKVIGGAYWHNPFNQQYEWTDDDMWIQPYYVTVGQGVDSIGNVPYATRVDSLFKYLEKAPNANWEIVWKDEVVHADLRNGDILKVTAQDGSTITEYYIDVQDYAAGENALLGAITWPDKQEFLEGWKGDTIPHFGSLKTNYNVLVPYGTKNVPALVAHAEDINAEISVERAVSLTGSAANRTTVFTVTAQLDTIYETYSVTFELEKDPVKVQNYEGTPFFSESATHQRSAMHYLEICNPGTVPMDLSEYMIVQSTLVNPAEAIMGLIPDVPSETNFKLRYASYVPGFSYIEDTSEWIINPGILSLDANVNPEVEPGGVFVMAATWANRAQYLTDFLLEDIDKRWSDSEDVLGIDEQRSAAAPRWANATYLFKIVGDSILDGKKSIGDPSDFELVDVLGDPIADLEWTVAGRSVKGVHRGWIKPKPYVYTGSRSLIECSESFGTHADTSDWIVNTYNNEIAHQDHIPNFIGSHVMDPVTVYISTITSPVYLVSDGYSDNETLQGDLTTTTVEAFLGNIDEADPEQVLTVLSRTDGSQKDAAMAVEGNDTLKVVSADGTNTTKYVLTDQPLDNNAVLTLADDPSDFSIEINESVGTISGVTYGSLLKDVVAGVVVPDLAVMNVIDSDGKLLPLQYMNYDSVKVDVLVGADIYFEVVAQDLVTIITYKLEPASLSSDAYVISSIYAVDEESDEISLIAEGSTVGLFFRNIEVVKGAQATAYTKLGHQRVDGVLSHDDVLKVVSEDGTNTAVYFLTFLNEDNPDANNAPEIILAFSDTTLTEVGTILLSATAKDDGLPPPANLTQMWEVSSGNAADVVIESADQLSSNVTFNANGDYTLTLSVNDGALTSQADVTVSVGGVGIDQIHAPSMRIYPNPATEKLTLELMNMPGSTSIVSIFSITGSAVFNAKLNSDKTEINLSSFESGLYFVKVYSEGHSFTQRIEIQK
ncbi:MAG: T9SS type A sorting domain-containing protein [Bacteroidetes bacterium]|nr:T9SS type A sorting domain-containing protein [Bacteroidota bacterium]